MVIDASAIVAIAFNAPEAAIFEQKVVDAPRRFISAATILELTIVIEARLGEAGAAELDLWLHNRPTRTPLPSPVSAFAWVAQAASYYNNAEHKNGRAARLFTD
ncbi:type II toxin-antitoxin system VapC family toxin [Sinorhizobium sp. 8-89]|uniref:type II toxin-antitoxin system VapC family toxin n=1 Tax=Sinorhizobium sp. 7-81 TaxID=3049087 RepID=UPI0024C384F2|nr:type II toxin-antitoxin system VapC family toxin [Sinorhizobium sp. 7-81]MDK1389675.1 type II toxin-antitoxin system VapC family toxin [Sinorhizobium sp. 7-81]